MQNSSQPTVALAILNYNSLLYLKQFLPVLKNNTPDWAKIYIIDNQSTDNSKQFVTENFPEITWIQLDRNYGFAGGYAKGLEKLQEDYWVLLNSDIEVSENWLEPLIQLLKENEQIAACQPKILSFQNRNYFEHAGAAGGFIDFLGYPFCRGRIFDHVEKDEGQYDEAIECFWASGACIAIKKEAYLQAGGFDDRFFMHMEEIELCWRMKKLGYQVFCEPKSVVYHVGGGMLDYENPTKLFYNFRNSLIMCYKNWPFKEMIWKLPVRITLDKVAMLREFIKGNFQAGFSILKALFSFIPFIFEPGKKVGGEEKLNKIYPNSIVKEYFLENRKTYQEVKK